MKTIETIVYQFDELTPEAQQKAIEKLCSINVAFEWWDSTYEDAFDAFEWWDSTYEDAFDAFEWWDSTYEDAKTS